jgi:hypothetical protein
VAAPVKTPAAASSPPRPSAARAASRQAPGSVSATSFADLLPARLARGLLDPAAGGSGGGGPSGSSAAAARFVDGDLFGAPLARLGVGEALALLGGDAPGGGPEPTATGVQIAGATTVPSATEAELLPAPSEDRVAPLETPVAGHRTAGSIRFATPGEIPPAGVAQTPRTAVSLRRRTALPASQAVDKKPVFQRLASLLRALLIQRLGPVHVIAARSDGAVQITARLSGIAPAEETRFVRQAAATLCSHSEKLAGATINGAAKCS